jgi:hypothetical protein
MEAGGMETITRFISLGVVVSKKLRGGVAGLILANA